MDRGDNLAGVGSLNGISTSRQNPTTLAGPPISLISRIPRCRIWCPVTPQNGADAFLHSPKGAISVEMMPSLMPPP